MKKIAVNTRLLLPGRVEGISRFTYEILKRMVERQTDTEFHFFFDRPYDPSYIFGENVVPHIVPPQSRHPILWYLWFHIQLPRLIKKIKADVVFSPEFYIPMVPNVPVVSTFHDLAYEHYPEDLPLWAARYLKKYSPRYAHASEKVLTVSEFSKQDLHGLYGLPKDNIHVVYNGVSDLFQALAEEEQRKVEKKYTQGAPYFHFVGTLHPRKNIESLLKAFEWMKEQSDSDIKLLLVGRKGWKYQSALDVYENMKHKEDVVFSGFVEDEELSRIYAASTALVYVPNLEGFGIPVLEALKSGTAVICSNNSSLPEVVGEGGIQVAPDDIRAIGQAMLKLHTDEKFRQDLIRKGQHQLTLFSWDKTYEKVWAQLKELL
ncbi:MAG: glycosyltransferase family 1 protein [Bacteroidota bacterium]